MQIIPAIDIYDGQSVRLLKGDFRAATKYATEPEVTARRFAEAGARQLHVVDLEGAKAGSIVNWKTLEKLGSIKELEIQGGGGVRSEKDIEGLLKIGMARVVIGSVAIRSPQTARAWAARFGPNQFCVALDVNDGSLMTGGWQTTELQSLTAAIVDLRESGITRFLSTDIQRDGALTGPNIPFYASLVQKYPDLEWLASGGVRSCEDLAALKSAGVAGVVIGKALHEGTLNLKEALKAC